MILSKTLLPVPLQGFAALHRQAHPVQNLLTSEGFVQVLDSDDRRTAVGLGFALLDRSLSCVFSRSVLECVHKLFRDASNSIPIKSYGKNMRMSFTSTTSARITKRDDSTTELVAAWPTPAAPPVVRMP